MLPKIRFAFKTSKGYLETLVPVAFTTDISKKYESNLDLDAYDQDIIENNIVKQIEAIAINLGNMNMDIEIYLEAETTSDIKISIIDDTIGIHSTRDTIDPDVFSELKSICTVIAGYLFDIYLKIKTSGSSSLSGFMDGLKETLGIGKGTVPTASSDIDEILKFITEKTKAEVVKPSETLDNYVCEKLLKEELEEIKDFFENEKTYKEAGITLPKGILFKGPPGTGKTYAARCIAGSVDCYFMTCTASALQGMYIGSGAENIRAVFKGAKMLREKSGKGVIIFIDEIDSFGSRESRSGGASGEEDRTLNQLLAELSGFEDAEGIMVLAATNYADRLDDALMRSGRFSRQITIGYPEKKERRTMIEFYFKKIKMPLEDTNYDEITELTEGLTPADIKEIVNESSILTIRHKLSKIVLNDINEAINKVITKNIKHEDGNLDVKLVSAHEAGHVLAEVLLEDSYPIKVTSYSYGDAGGFTQSAFRLSGILNKIKFINYIKILLGGRAAEEVICGTITNGASNDLAKAKKILRNYYETYMFEKYDQSKLEQIILDELHKIYEEVVILFKNPENKLKLENLTTTLYSERTLYTKDIKSMLMTSYKGGSIF